MHLSRPWSILVGFVGLLVFLVVGEWIFRCVMTRWLGVKTPRDWRDRVQKRYDGLKFFWWMFTYFKMRIDPMFRELPAFVQGDGVKTIGDVGCGTGVAGCALLEWLPEARIFGIDPAPGRIAIASTAFGERGRAVVGAAPDVDVPGMPGRLDAVIILDVIHYLTDADFALTLQRLRARLDVGGKLIIRSITPPAPGGGTIFWRIGCLNRKLMRVKTWHRPVGRVGELISRNGFAIEQSKISGGNAEMVWIVSRAL